MIERVRKNERKRTEEKQDATKKAKVWVRCNEPRTMNAESAEHVIHNRKGQENIHTHAQLSYTGRETERRGQRKRRHSPLKIDRRIADVSPLTGNQGAMQLTQASVVLPVSFQDGTRRKSV